MHSVGRGSLAKETDELLRDFKGGEMDWGGLDDEQAKGVFLLLNGYNEASRPSSELLAAFDGA